METPVLIPNTEVKRSCGDDTRMKGKVASRRYKVFNLVIIIESLIYKTIFLLEKYDFYI